MAKTLTIRLIEKTEKISCTTTDGVTVSCNNVIYSKLDAADQAIFDSFCTLINNKLGNQGFLIINDLTAEDCIVDVSTSAALTKTQFGDSQDIDAGDLTAGEQQTVSDFLVLSTAI